MTGTDDATLVPSGGGPLVFVADLSAPVLDGDDHHHLARVRRVRDGDDLIVADGAGSWRRARMAGDRPTVDGPVVSAPRRTPAVAVGFGLSKGAKPEWCVQKLTELAVDRIRPFVAARSVVRWDASKAAAAHERFVKVAREAAMQSRSAWLPTIDPLVDLGTLVGPGVARADRGGAPLRLSSTTTVLVGPEGGWDDAERALDLPTVALADGVLRAETAAVVAGALLVALRSALVAPA